MTINKEQADRLLSRFGQQQVLRFFHTLDPTGQARLLAQIEALDLSWIDAMMARSSEDVPRPEIAPFGDVLRPGDPLDARAEDLGRQALEQGRVGVLIVAGGQGTRLGFDGPKGCFPIGPVSGHSLFQVLVEGLVAVGRKFHRAPALYVMTSEDNHQATCRVFERQHNFGLPRDRVMIFPQGLAPAVDHQGKLLLSAPDRLVLAPNGNGGAFAALRQSGAFEHMAGAGVDTLSYVHVDNPLAPPCDARFIGHHLLRQAPFSCKAMPKTGPGEKVGSFARVNGKLGIVEYTEISPEQAAATGPDGELLFGLANPGLYLWSRAFAQAQASRVDLPFHRAHKKIPHLDARGRLVRPDAPCGYKFEAFAMDTLADAEPTLLMLCQRDEEFAPVKNATGKDSPDSARELMCRLHKRWIERAGGRFLIPEARVEISPIYALDAEDLARRLPPGFEVKEDLFLEAP